MTAMVANQASSSPSPNPASLGEYVVPMLLGFISQATSLSGGPTGKIGFNEATSSDCNVGDPQSLSWLASELRYYDDSPRYKDTYELLCVSEFKATAVPPCKVKFSSNWFSEVT